MTDFAFLTIAEAAKLLNGKEISPVEYAQSLLDRISAHDGAYNSFLHVSADMALDEARAAESEIMAGNWRGPLHGVPARRDLPGLRAHPAGHLPAGLCLLQRTSRGAEHALPARPLLPERHGDGGPPKKRHDVAALPLYTWYLLFSGRRR